LLHKVENTWRSIYVMTFLLVCQQIIGQEKTDSSKLVSLDDIVVIASKVPESWMKTGVQKAGKSYFQKSSAASFFDALEHIKGVQMITPSMGFRILNTRGFNNTTNVRFVQMVDGIDVQSPHIGSPIGNALGPSDLDIRNVEISPGVAATLYGMNAVNGVADFSTRDPFTDQGLSVQQKTGLAHLGGHDVSAKVYSETDLRYAKAINNKWAIKLTFSYNRGYDWIADDMTDINPNANLSTGLTGEDNPAKDPVNSYGNESPNRRTLALNGKRYVVARTGYTEKQITDYQLNILKAGVAVHYAMNKNTMLSYSFRSATLDNVYQRANRFRLENYFLQQQALQLKSGAVKANLYYNGENTGRSYNLRSAAENMDRAFKTDGNWFADYSRNFLASTAGTDADRHRDARALTDQGRFEPGTQAFNDILNKVSSINNWDSGAALRVKAAFIHGDLQWDLSEKLAKTLGSSAGLELLWGVDFRTYFIQPDGNYFINPKADKADKDLVYSKYGSFVSLNKELLQKKIRLGFAVRADKYDYFKVYFSPRFTASYSPVLNHSIRASLQQGYRFPIIFEAFSNVNSGGVKG
jgi:iron complex outermembrane recepter protein